MGDADADAEPIPELKFDQTLGWADMAHVAERGKVRIKRWLGAVSVVACQRRSVIVEKFALLTRLVSFKIFNKSDISGLCP